MSEPIKLVFRPQARALKNEVQANGGSITLQTQSPVTLGFVNDGFERYVDVARVLRGVQGARGEKGQDGAQGIQGIQGVPGPNEIGGFPVAVANPQENDTLLLKQWTWQNTPQEALTDGGNF